MSQTSNCYDGGKVLVSVLLLTQAEVERLLDPDALLNALAEGFKALSESTVSAPPRNQATTPDGILLAMPGWAPGNHIAVKLVTVFHGNVQRGLPGHQALICLFDAETGTPAAMMDGTYITAMRTAGGAALATRLLARPSAHVLAIIGAGVQGKAHLTLLPRVRPSTEIRIASRDRTHAQRLAAADPRARVASSFEEAVRGADIVCLCTASQDPVIDPAWLKPGAHVTSVGYHPPGGELPRALAEHGRLFVETRGAFAPPPAGCAELEGLDPEKATELGEVLLSRRPGRQSAEEITVYKSMGHAVEDMVTANLVYRRAVAEGAGRLVDF